MRIRIGASVGCLLLCLALGGSEEADARKDEVSITLKRKRAKEQRLNHYGDSLELVAGRAFELGDYEIVPTVEKRGLRLVWDAAQPKLAKLIPTKTKGAEVQVGTGSEALTLYVWRDELGRFYRNNAAALSGVVNGTKLLFFDLDHNGEYFDEAVDAFGPAGSGYMTPWFDAAVVHDARIEKLGYDDTKRKLRLRVTPMGPNMSEEGRRALKSLNDVRLWYGLLPCDVDEKLNAWCRKHSNWMAANRQVEHVQPPGSPQYSKEGNEAGINSLVGSDSSPEQNLLGLFDTPLHGYEISSPMMTSTAIASVGNYITVWYRQAHGLRWRRKQHARLPAVFPPHRATGIPVSWWDEEPDPRPGDPSTDWGYPIRVYLEADGTISGEFPKNMKATLKPAKGRRSKPVPCVVVYDPASVQTEGGYQGGGLEVIVMPRPVLERDTKYHLRLEYRYKEKDVVWESVFTTGSQRGGYRSEVEK
ncbi:MAG: hypothetical protein QNJ98_17205 [Planctomycetota bacterium]|nr:hypothetical protein [Planctomycetota bacterium]